MAPAACPNIIYVLYSLGGCQVQSSSTVLLHGNACANSAHAPIPAKNAVAPLAKTLSCAHEWTVTGGQVCTSENSDAVAVGRWQ